MKKSILGLCFVLALTACDKDKIENVVVPLSNGSTMQLNGLISNEAGAMAGNSVFVDFSTDKQYPVARASWDLGFYCGSDFRVIINNTTVALANVINKTDINTVNSADTAGRAFALSQEAPSATHFSLLDNIDGDLSKTVISAVSATANDNKVIVINRGTGGGIPAKDFIKIKVLRNGAYGYTLQYAKLTETSFRTINIDKDSKYNFKYVSFDNGTVNVEPAKDSWDIQWSYAAFKTNFGGGFVPYPFSDLVAINNMNGTKVVEKSYATDAEASTAFTSYKKENLESETFSSDKWRIGSGWRRTSPPGATNPAGTLKTKFYIVKDFNGNYYKLKFTSFTSEDGGTRGKPEIKYELIK